MSNKKNSKRGMTRQGVLDLSHLKGKSVGRRLEMPPKAPNQCKHSKTRKDEYSGDSTCLECGTTWNYLGSQYE